MYNYLIKNMMRKQISQGGQSGSRSGQRKTNSQNKTKSFRQNVKIIKHNFTFETNNQVNGINILKREKVMKNIKQNVQNAFSSGKYNYFGFAFQYEFGNLLLKINQRNACEVHQNTQFQLPIGQFRSHIEKMKKLINAQIEESFDYDQMTEEPMKETKGAKQILALIEQTYFNTDSNKQKYVKGDIDFFVTGKLLNQVQILKNGWIIQNFTKRQIVEENQQCRVIFQLKKNLVQDRNNNKKDKSVENLTGQLNNSNSNTLVSNLCQIIKNILAIRIYDLSDCMELDQYLQMGKEQLIKIKKPTIVMYLVVNSNMKMQEFEDHLSSFKMTIKMWLQKLDARLNIVGFNPDLRFWQKDEYLDEELKRKAQEQDSKIQFLEEQNEEKNEKIEEQNQKIEELRNQIKEQNKLNEEKNEKIEKQNKHQIQQLREMIQNLMSRKN